MLPTIAAAIGHRNMVSTLSNREAAAMSTGDTGLPALSFKMLSSRFFIGKLFEEIVKAKCLAHKLKLAKIVWLVKLFWLVRSDRLYPLKKLVEQATAAWEFIMAAHFRLEAVLDQGSGLYSVEVYYPAESTVPYIKSKSRFATEGAAFSFAKEALASGLDQPVQDLKPN